MIPEINKIYNYFDDGKINESRRYEVVIRSITPFTEATAKTLKFWKKEVKQCHWLYATETDYFIKGMLLETKEDVIFVRCKKNGWFSLGWNGGRLDIDGSLYEYLLKQRQELKN